MSRAAALVGLFIIGACVASAETIDLVDTIPGTFIDISGIGTNLNLGDEDEAEVFTTVGNDLLPAGRVVVANNGGIAFDPPDTNLPPLNEPLGRGSTAFGGGQALLIHWDDVGNDVGGVFSLELEGTLIVQWQGRFIGGTRAARATFQIQIFEQSEATTPYFQFLYQDITAAGGGASATIGYQDGGAGFNTEAWSFNTPNAVGDGRVLTVLPEPSTLALLMAAMLLRRTRR